MLIRVSSAGLQGHSVFLAHEGGGWGPEKKGDYKNHQLTLSEDGELQIDGSFLVDREEFKLVVPCDNAEEANAIYVDRQKANVHVGDRFDYDGDTVCFWLLASSHDVVRLGEWNQNNVYHES